MVFNIWNWNNMLHNTISLNTLATMARKLHISGMGTLEHAAGALINESKKRDHLADVPLKDWCRDRWFTA
jgi:hypothetical protein